MESILTERNNTITKLEQRVREQELKTQNEPKHSASASSGGGGGDRDWQAHSKEQSKKIVALRREIRELKEMAEVKS